MRGRRSVRPFEWGGSAGRVVPADVADLEPIWAGYEAQMAAACARNVDRAAAEWKAMAEFIDRFPKE